MGRTQILDWLPFDVAGRDNRGDKGNRTNTIGVMHRQRGAGTLKTKHPKQTHIIEDAMGMGKEIPKLKVFIPRKLILSALLHVHGKKLNPSFSKLLINSHHHSNVAKY